MKTVFTTTRTFATQRFPVVGDLMRLSKWSVIQYQHPSCHWKSSVNLNWWIIQSRWLEGESRTTNASIWSLVTVDRFGFSAVFFHSQWLLNDLSLGWQNQLFFWQNGDLCPVLHISMSLCSLFVVKKINCSKQCLIIMFKNPTETRIIQFGQNCSSKSRRTYLYDLRSDRLMIFRRE